MNIKKSRANRKIMNLIVSDTKELIVINEIIDPILAICSQGIIREKYGIVYDPMMKKWVKILTKEEAQKIVDEVDAKVIK